VFQRLVVERKVRHHGLQPAVLVLERLEALRVGDLQAAELRLPAVEGGLGDSHPPRDVRRLGAGVDLLLRADDLLLGELALAHPSSTSSRGLAFRSV
jgi:hypothetical protein